jgi:hypothetical protein
MGAIRRLLTPVPVNIAGVAAELDYAIAGPLTALAGVTPAALAGIAPDPVGICQHVHSLVIQPHDAMALGLAPERIPEKEIRPAARLAERLLELDPAPLNVPREPAACVVGTCRHFAVLGCALLRHRRFAARARCGFATYFQAGVGLDHWIIEYRDAAGRWVRVDTELLGTQDLLDHPDDLPPGAFLTGGEAWSAYRQGQLDASVFGVYGTENFGPAEIRGNAIRDLAALNKVETLPWDEWGQMSASYKGTTGADYDEFIDTIAAACAAAEPEVVASLYDCDELRVPAELSR